MPKIVLSPTILISLVFTYGFIIWSLWLSFSKSRLLPNYDWVGFVQYERLFSNDRWWVASSNLIIFGILFVAICLAIGLLLAILLDQQIRYEGKIRAIYLYPMALSFIVTGTAWKWLLNPELGLQKMMHSIGFESFRFEWLVETNMAIYTVVIAAVWQSSGFIMALCLAGLRGINTDIIKAAKIDGAPLHKIYIKIIIPMLRPVFFSAIIILVHIAIKSFDLVIALTGGGPGFSSDLPATFIYTFAFTRGEIGLGSAASMIMLMAVISIVIPYLYSEIRINK